MKSATAAPPLTTRMETPDSTSLHVSPELRAARRRPLDEAGWTTRWTSSPLLRSASPLTVNDTWTAVPGRRAPAPASADD